MVNTVETQKITDAEWEIMRVVWAQEKVTSSEISHILNQKTKWQPTTIKTLLGRLVNKEMLATEKSGNKFIYSPLVEERRSVQAETDELLGKICAKKVGETIEAIIHESELSFDDIDRIEALLKEKRKTAVDVVACNCTPGQCQCQ